MLDSNSGEAVQVWGQGSDGDSIFSAHGCCELKIALKASSLLIKEYLWIQPKLLAVLALPKEGGIEGNFIMLSCLIVTSTR